MVKINKDEFISILQERGWYSFEDSGIDFRSALPRGIQSIIEGMLITGLYKMKGTIVFKDGCYPDVPILVGDEQTIKQDNQKQDTITENKTGAVDTENEQLKSKLKEFEKQVNELKETVRVQSKQMDEDDKEFLALQKEYKELQTKMEQSVGNTTDIDNYQTVAMKDGKGLTVMELVIEYTEEKNRRVAAENELEDYKKNYDVALKKECGEIIKKNEYLQEDLDKATKEVGEYKQEAANTAKYFLKFKVGYDIMLENGAKEPDKKLVDKEVKNILKAKEELQLNEKYTEQQDIELD